MQKILTAIFSTILLSFILSVLSYTPTSLRAADTGYSAFGELLYIYILYSAPVFILGGLVVSFVIERMSIDFSFFKKHTYLTNLILYAIAGIIIGALFLFVISEGGNSPHGFHYGYFSVLCIAGSVLFYHLNMIIKKWLPRLK